MVRLVRALARGVDDVTTPAGVRLLVAALALVLSGQLLVNTVFDGLVVSALGLSVVVSYAVTLPVGPAAATWLLVVLWVVGSYVLVVVCRAFAAPGESLRVEDLTRDALPATLRTAVAVAAGGALTLAGLAFGVAPGILLAAHLLFVPVFVAVDGDGLDDAVVRSWRLTAAERVRVLALTTFGAAVAAAALVGVGALVGPTLELLLGSAAAAAVAVSLVAVAVDVRQQHGDGGPGRARRSARGAGV
jgi:hypothetical protein